MEIKKRTIKKKEKEGFPINDLKEKFIRGQMQKNEYLSRPKIYISLIFIMSTYQRGIKTQEEARQG